VNVLKIGNYLINRHILNPLLGMYPIDFKTHLRESTRILICSPSLEIVKYQNISLSEFGNIFPRKGLTVFYPDSDGLINNDRKLEEVLDQQIPIRNKSILNFWNTLRSPTLKELKILKIDILLDLDPEFNLLNIYLSQILHPPLRISFVKNKSNFFYNLQYKGKPDASYAESIQGLLEFLKSFRD